MDTPLIVHFVAEPLLLQDEPNPVSSVRQRQAAVVRDLLHRPRAVHRLPQPRLAGAGAPWAGCRRFSRGGPRPVLDYRLGLLGYLRDPGRSR